jgi:hypothetical protein
MFTLIGIGSGLLFYLLFGLFFQNFFPNEFKTESGTVHLYFEATTVILTLHEKRTKTLTTFFVTVGDNHETPK